MEENRTERGQVCQMSVRVYSEDRESWKRIKEEAGLATDAQVMAELVQMWYDPIKIKNETERLQSLLTQKDEELAKSIKNIDQLSAKIKELEKALASAEREQNKNGELSTSLQLQLEKQEEELEALKPKDNEHVLTISPDNWKALEMVAERESKRRSQNWSVSHVVNFFVWARFVKGLLNGDLNSLSDSELKQAGIAINKKTGGIDL